MDTEGKVVWTRKEEVAKVMFDASREKDGQTDITKLVVGNILNNNNFIQFMLKIRKITLRIYVNVLYQDQEYKGKGKGTAVPLQDWTGPEGSRKLRFPNFVIKT